MRSFVRPGVALAVAFAIAALSIALPSSTEAQRRRARRPSPGSTAAASADPQTDTEARALFEAGREAFDEGRYESALDSFTRAYALSGRPGLLFNIASTGERLRRDAEALRAYEAYLDAMPDAPNREYAEARIAFLRQQLQASAAPETSAVTASVSAALTTPGPTPSDETAPTPSATAPAAVRLAVPDEQHDEEVEVLDPPLAAGASTATGSGGEPRDEGVDLAREWWFWTLLGVAVVGAGVGIAAGVLAAQDSSAPSPMVRGDFGPGGVIVALEGN